MNSFAATVVLVALAGQPAPESERAVPSVGQWLVELGRHEWLAADESTAPTALGMALALAEAASAIEPELPEAHRQRFELYMVHGDRPAATAALADSLRLAPDDESAWLEWVELQIESLQTADRRDAFCREQLENVRIPPAVASDLHRRLAASALDGGRRDDAIRHATSAVHLFATNIAAGEIRLNTLGESATPRDRIEHALRRVQANPARRESAWVLARQLDEHALHDEAWSWYRHAIEPPGVPLEPPPTALRLDLVESLIDGGRSESAMELCRQVISAEPAEIRARLLMARIGEKLEQPKPSRESVVVVREMYDRFAPKVFANQDGQAAATLAFFYAYYDQDRAQADALARIAITADGQSESARLAAGFAALRNDRHGQVDEHLAALADTNQLAAVGLAESLLARQRRDEAVEVLRRAASLRATGEAFDRVASWLHRLEQEVPAPPKHQDLRDSLAAFERDALQFFVEPRRHLALSMTLKSERVAPGESWQARFTLTNTSGFPITLGGELMVNPVVLLSAVIRGDGVEALESYLAVPLTGRLRLEPGNHVTRVATLNVGRLRQVLAPASSGETTVEFRGLFNPRPTPEGTWETGPGGYAMTPVRGQQIAFVASPPSLNRLSTDLHAGSPADRRRAAAQLGALAAAHSGRPDSASTRRPDSRVDLASIHALLLGALEDRDPSVRAAALEALRAGPLTRQVINRASAGLRDPHWLVRMFAVRLFATRQGEVFVPVARRMAGADPDPKVRRLARAYIPTDAPNP